MSHSKRSRDIFASDRIPLYYQLESLLRDRINSGAFAPGDRIPTENDLIREYNLSRITVRLALQALVDEGLIERKQGSGTYVTDRKSEIRKLEKVSQYSGSLNDFEDADMALQLSLIDVNNVLAGAYEADMLSLREGERLLRLRRLCKRNGEPYGVASNFVPMRGDFQFSQEVLQETQSLQLSTPLQGNEVVEVRQQISADVADPYVAGLLNVRVGSPLLVVERTLYLGGGRPIELMRTIHRSDRFCYSISLKRGYESPERVAA